MIADAAADDFGLLIQNVATLIATAALALSARYMPVVFKQLDYATIFSTLSFYVQLVIDHHRFLNVFALDGSTVGAFFNDKKFSCSGMMVLGINHRRDF